MTNHSAELAAGVPGSSLARVYFGEALVCVEAPGWSLALPGLVRFCVFP